MKPNDFRVFIDLDGVVADWLGKAIQTFGININSPAIINILSTDVRGLEQIIDVEHMWSVINAGDAKWWEEIDLLPWGKYLYDSVCKVLPGGAEHVCFLTQPSEHGSSAAGKAHWIQKHFKTDNYLLGKPKHFAACKYSMLIDDTPKKINAFVEAGGHGLLFPNVWKLKVDYPSTGLIEKWKIAGTEAVDDLIVRVKDVMQKVRQEEKEWDSAAMLTYIRAGRIKMELPPVEDEGAEPCSATCS